MNGRSISAAALMILLLMACTPTRYPTPASPVADVYPDGDSGLGAIDGRVPEGWRQYFRDKSLLAVIELALDNNRDLRAAALHVEEARATYRIQRADQVPSLGGVAAMDRSRVPRDLSMTGAPLLASQYQVGLALSSWELDLWGRIRNLKQAALQRFLATESARRAATVSLVAQIANSYLGLRELDERIALAQDTIRSRAESSRIFRLRFEQGSISRLDLAQVEALLDQARALGAELELARATQAHLLTSLVGAPVASASARGSLDEQVVAADLAPGLPSGLLLRRPDVVAAEHRLQAAHADVGAARAAFLPNVVLTASAGTASAELDGLFQAGSRVWTFSPSLTLPIFAGGRLRASLELSEVRRDLAVADYEKTVQQAFREVADALAARRWLAEQLRYYDSLRASQAERARLAQLRYDNGAATYLEVLDAQRELLTVEQQLVSLRRSVLSSRIDLYAALGGGLE